MCGRYVSVRADADLLDEFDATVVGSEGEAYEADYNVAPTKPVRIIVNRPLRDADGAAQGDSVRQLRTAVWGLVPSWAKDRSIGARMINARCEGLRDARAFRRAYASRRCLVPADGWYEWHAGASARRQAYYMTPADGHVLAFAGLYEFWRAKDEGAPWVTSTSIVTCAAEGLLAGIHDRMPLVLPRSAWARWLDPGEADPADLLHSWDEAAAEHLELRPVGARVGDYRNNGPDLIEAVDPQPAEQTLFS